MARADRIQRLLKKSVKAEFTRIYISFYNLSHKCNKPATYVWIREVKTIFAGSVEVELTSIFNNVNFCSLNMKAACSEFKFFKQKRKQ